MIDGLGRNDPLRDRLALTVAADTVLAVVTALGLALGAFTTRRRFVVHLGHRVEAATR